MYTYTIHPPSSHCILIKTTSPGEASPSKAGEFLLLSDTCNTHPYLLLDIKRDSKDCKDDSEDKKRTTKMEAGDVKRGGVKKIESNTEGDMDIDIGDHEGGTTTTTTASSYISHEWDLHWDRGGIGNDTATGILYIYTSNRVCNAARTHENKHSHLAHLSTIYCPHKTTSNSGPTVLA